jgi:hypothetical protein
MKYIGRGFVFVGTMLIVLLVLFVVVAAIGSLWSGDFSSFTRLGDFVDNDYGKMLAVYVILSLLFGFLMWGGDK